jgi:hypothetical protein
MQKGTCRRQHRGQQGGRSSGNAQHLIHHSQLRSAASAATIIAKTATVFRGKNTHQDTSQVSGQSEQAKNVNSNATDEVFLTSTSVQQVMTERS